ncbi:CRE-LFE-2 protein [Caenorhabditis remanei]|uniref:Kinase n=1 Tax=Caenorhabditis remanei TaxID=31234 RepID=E3MX58_CAERE|nr:CRE-LFE-2 protein [Caenorhabditis remanei]
MLEAIYAKIMGVGSSRHDKRQGCWSWGESSNGEEKRMKRPKKLPSKLRLKISGNQRRRREDTFVVWEEIPTPSVCDHRDTMNSDASSTPSPPSAPTQERLMQIISCFPYPTTRPASPQCPPPKPQLPESCEHRAFCDAFGKLVQVSVETMAITALPMDVWLKERLKKWVQLSGHEGSIVPATPHTLYKKQCANCGEGRAYKNISKDAALNGFTPKYYNELEKNEEHFIEIEDLLQQFADPTKTAIMDIKIGTRTFLESEVSNTKKRADLYEKMVAIDNDEPTEEERKAGAITKLRYMQFRERESSTAQLGFRIEAAKRLEGALEKNFKKVRTVEDVTTTFMDFFGIQRSRVRAQLIERLKSMRKAIENSTFFNSHEVVGSSILIVFDTEKVGCWMIDFAKSSPVPNGRSLNHRTNWVPGNNEDGYLIGIDNLVKILEDLPEYGEHPDDQLMVTEEVIARMKNSK